MLAIKKNKQYTITEAQKEKYVAEGYDIADDDGEIVQHHSQKTVPYGEYVALAARVAALEKENAALKKKSLK